MMRIILVDYSSAKSGSLLLNRKNVSSAPFFSNFMSKALIKDFSSFFPFPGYWRPGNIVSMVTLFSLNSFRNTSCDKLFDFFEESISQFPSRT